MKKLIYIGLSILFFNQAATAQSSFNPLNPNDTTLLRIYNGVIIQNNFHIKNFDRVSMIKNKEDLELLGFNPDVPILIIEYELYDIENKIDSVLYNRESFISRFKFPLNIQLPLSINNKPLSVREKKKILPGLRLDKIKKIEYIDSKESMKSNGITPWGMVELTLF